MRGLLAGLRSPHPVGERLPGLYQDDDFTQRFCASLDEGLAPVMVTLDSLPAYFDPATTPDDALGWLASWVGLALADGQTTHRQRELVAAGVELLRWRGTAQGVGDAVQILLDVVPEVIETGGAEWSASPGAALPGEPGARMLVRLVVPDPAAVDTRQVDELIAAIKPVHVLHELEVLASPDARAAPEDRTP
jgi:phage tail-like protein